MSRLLVTGAAGFIGRQMVTLARDQGHEVIESRAQGEALVGELREGLPAGIEAVVHLAGRYPLRGQPALTTTQLFNANVAPTMALLDACARQDIRRAVLASTANVYAPAADGAIGEDAPLALRNGYAVTKRCAELLVTHHGGVSLRLFNVYGPGSRGGDVLGSIARRALGGDTVHMRDDRPVRDFVHVADVARALLAAATCTTPLPPAINIGSGQGTRIRDLARAVLDAAGRDDHAVPDYHTGDPVDVSIADIRLAREVLGWQPLLSLAEGIDTVIDALAGPSNHRHATPCE